MADAKIIRLEPGNGAARRAYGRRRFIPATAPVVSQVDDDENTTARFLAVSAKSRITIDVDDTRVVFSGCGSEWQIHDTWFGVSHDEVAGEWTVIGGGITPFTAPCPVAAYRELCRRDLIRTLGGAS